MSKYLKAINQANKLLNKICSIFLPWQIYLHNDKIKNNMCKDMIFVRLKVGKYQRPGLLCWWASSFGMSNNIKTYIMQIMIHLFHNTYFCLHFSKMITLLKNQDFYIIYFLLAIMTQGFFKIIIKLKIYTTFKYI